MHILFSDWDCFGKSQAILTLKNMGHKVFLFAHKDFTAPISTDFNASFDKFVEKHAIDLCFSYNYSAPLSEAAKKHNLPYIAFVYDSPLLRLYSYTVINPNNHIFLFDRFECSKLNSMGITTVKYMPLPTDASAIQTLLKQPSTIAPASYDVSFVGSLYNEKHNIFERMKDLSPYAKGYLDGLMQAQMQVSGYNFIEEVLPKDIVAEMHSCLKYNNERYGVETLEYIYSDYVINRKITQLERRKLLTSIAGQFKLSLFTLDPNASIPGAVNHGPISYTTEMPLVFNKSRINLNISLRSIKSGIPLRCMDILGAGGFLLTNYQADFLEHFIPDVDFVYYEDEKDLLYKIDYYLSHDEKRKEIAGSGHQKVLENHSFEKCFNDIFDHVFH